MSWKIKAKFDKDDRVWWIHQHTSIFTGIIVGLSNAHIDTRAEYKCEYKIEWDHGHCFIGDSSLYISKDEAKRALEIIREKKKIREEEELTRRYKEAQVVVKQYETWQKKQEALNA